MSDLRASQRPLVVLAAGQARRFGGCKPLAPVGVRGEALIDVLLSDALEAGFSRVVLVVNPATGPSLRAHVARAWPSAVEVDVVEQAAPRGTVDAVLAARPALSASSAFVVVNADDLYGAQALSLILAMLVDGAPSTEHAMVSFQLAKTLLGGGRVNRGVCSVDDAGYLRGLQERRGVGFADVVSGANVTTDDGRKPATLAADTPTAMNLWGFQPTIWPVFEGAQAEFDGLARALGDAARGELLIPEVIGRSLDGPDRLLVRVQGTHEPCLGVTHPGDVEAVRAHLVHAIRQGRRQPTPWDRARLVGVPA